MVALVVRLKLTLLKNSLRRSVWRTVGLVLGMLYALGLVLLAVAGLIALRWTSLDFTASVTVTAFSLLTIGWLLMSLLVFGVDETVDPARFALLPLRARELMPGLLIAGLLGSPGVATVLVGAGLIAAWARSVPLTLAAVVALPLGVVTCFLFSRAATAAFARFLGSRRFRDIAVVALALLGALLGIGANLIGNLAAAGPAAARTSVDAAALVLGWSPFGWAWALPADVGRGQWVAAGAHLVLALGLIAGLWAAWGSFLSRRLTEPIDAGGGLAVKKHGTALERLLPASPAGGVATRTLRYWRRDPRYLAGVAGFLIAPVIVLVTQVATPEPSTPVIAFAPVLLGMFLGLSLAQDLSYDGSALWAHIAAGLSGRDDRRGRVISTLIVFGPLQIVLIVLSMVLSGRWDLLPVVVGLAVGFSLTGLGVGCYVGVLWQWPAPPPGSNPFQKGSSGGLPSLLSFSLSGAISMALSLPLTALAVGTIWAPWLRWPALLVGVGGGVVVLLLGIRKGGDFLDRRWPEVMAAVSERSG